MRAKTTKSKKNVRILIILLMIGLIAGIAYWLWVKSIALPVLGDLASFEMETVSGETYKSESGKIQLYSFIESDCGQSCSKLMTNLKTIQGKLIEYGSFGDTVEILSVSKDMESGKDTLQQYIDQYSINQDGWHILVPSNEQFGSLTKNLGYTVEQPAEVYLIDANKRIRQSYDLTDKSVIQEIIDDITQLIRIQQQALGE